MSEPKRVQEYRNEAITVRFDPNICAHSATCIRRLPSVFDLKGRPWINLAGASTDEIAALIERCPSGALTYTRHDQAVATVDLSEATEIQALPNGPLRVKGKVRVLDAQGNLLLEGDKCSLCRCGASQKKPFCDGSHRDAGFVG